LVLFDRRGTGLSERGLDVRGFDARMDDINAVLDAVGSDRCGHIGVAIGGRVALLFAATFPERTSAVATIAGHPATFKDEPDYPWGTTREDMDRITAQALEGWGGPGNVEGFLSILAPSMIDDPFTRDRWLRLSRSATWWRAAAWSSRMPGSMS
jgi:pimeloyl-ACP methyl ester carboxylesterase